VFSLYATRVGTIADVGAMAAGGIPTPIYATNTEGPLPCDDTLSEICSQVQRGTRRCFPIRGGENEACRSNTVAGSSRC